MELESIMLSEIGPSPGGPSPGGEGQIPYDLTFNRNLINKTNKQAKYNQDTEIENRLTVTRGETGGDYRSKG